jgi:hypothetical protein
MMEEMKAEAKKYVGVDAVRNGGRLCYRAKICVEGFDHSLGYFDCPKAAAKAYDMFVLKNRLGRKTNFIKKKPVTNE